MMTMTRHANYTALDIAGKLRREDYEQLVPRLEQAIAANGPLRVLIKLDDFEGWTPSGLIDELRFDLRHRKDFECIAVLGTGNVQKIATRIAAPFFSGEVRFFEDEGQARQWLM